MNFILALFLGVVPRHASTGQVPAKRTVLSTKKAKEYLSEAFVQVVGRRPTNNELKMLSAHSAMETRRWQAMWNWNFGNSVASGGPWFTLKEASKHKYRPFNDPHSGAVYFINLMKNKFTKAWHVLGNGNPAEYAVALKEQRYYEAPINKYTQALSEHYRSV